MLTVLFCFVVGLSAQQILCYHNRRSPREERVYGYSDRSAVKSGAIEKQGVFVYHMVDRTMLFYIPRSILFKSILPPLYYRDTHTLVL